ncbi:MAG: hypothetical protein COA79_14610 [Planctomycetota bacterium]|nr:MAG: hypothetical protein COA79_14610 [Planctomycetota bacterium]
MSFWTILFTAVISGFIGTLILTPFIIKLGIKLDIVDHPGVRKIHKTPIPLLGGLAVFITVAILAPATDHFFIKSGLSFNREWIALLGGSFIMIMLGFLDDRIGFGAKEKFIFQFGAAILACLMGWRIESISLPLIDGSIELGLISIPFTVLVIVGTTNAVNMIDGMDGAASGICLIAFAACAYIFWYHQRIDYMIVSLLFTGSLLGFLVYNFNPAKIFLGDTGSLFLGYNLALFALKAPSLKTPDGEHFINSVSLFVTISILFYPILDFTLAVIRRTAKGSSIFRPDKSHIHHKLLTYFSWNPKISVLFIYFLGLCGGVCGIMIFRRNEGGLLATALLYIGILLYIYKKFQYREAISEITKLQKNKTKTLLHFQKFMDLKLELVQNVSEVEHLLQWVMEENEIKGLAIRMDDKIIIQLGDEVLPEQTDIKFSLTGIKGTIYFQYINKEFYNAELERELCLQTICQNLNIVLSQIEIKQ